MVKTRKQNKFRKSSRKQNKFRKTKKLRGGEGGEGKNKKKIRAQRKTTSKVPNSYKKYENSQPRNNLNSHFVTDPGIATSIQPNFSSK
jgi:hypothetical protein